MHPNFGAAVSARALRLDCERDCRHDSMHGVSVCDGRNVAVAPQLYSAWTMLFMRGLVSVALGSLGIFAAVETLHSMKSVKIVQMVCCPLAALELVRCAVPLCWCRTTHGCAPCSVCSLLCTAFLVRLCRFFWDSG